VRAIDHPRVTVTAIDRPRVSVTVARETIVPVIVDADEVVAAAVVAAIARVSDSLSVVPTETVIAVRRAASKKSTPNSSPADAVKSVTDARWAGISCACTSATT
jgi:hypothetical protein